MEISKVQMDTFMRNEFWYATGAWWTGWALGVLSGWLATYVWFLQQ